MPGSFESEASARRHGITGGMSRIYDVFVDWSGRLGRELPGLERHLASVGAKRVLDVGCGTGRHVQALLERGYDAHGADLSEDMLDQARGVIGEPGRLHRWRLGDEPPASLAALAPFDAVIAMGNVWPQLTEERDARDACAAFRRLLRPGGLVLLGLKAFAVREASGQPYLPLLRRVHEDRPLWFVRFVDFAIPAPAEGVRVCDLHMSVLAGDATTEEERVEALLHRASRVRVWAPDELGRWLAAQGFVDVRVSGRLDDPTAEPASEDVFASARTP